MNGRRVAILSGFVVSGVLVWIALRRIDFDVVIDSFGDMRWWVVAPALAVLALAVVLRALSWQALFEPTSRPRTASTLRATLVGMMLNLILPLRAGEAARVLALARETRTSRVEALATAVTQRLFDMLVLLFLLFAATPFLPAVRWLETAAAFAFALLIVLIAIVATLVAWGERPIRWVLGGLARVPGVSVDRTRFAALNFVQGLAGLRRPGVAARGIMINLASWFAVALSNWLLLVGFDFGLAFDAALLVAITTNLALVVPSSPAAIGTFEAAVLVALSAYGIDESRALSYAILLHLLNFAPIILAGLIALHQTTTVDRPALEGRAGPSE